MARRAGRRSRANGASVAAVRIRGPSPVIATVCSKWAASEPSAVEIDHSSSCRTTSAPPAVIIGSIAKVIPSESSGPGPARRSSGSAAPRASSAPTPWPTRLRTTEKPCSSVTRWIGVRDVRERGCRSRHCSIPAASAAWQPSSRRSASGGDLADRERVGRVRHEAVERHADVDREDVAVAAARSRPGIPWTTIVVRRGADRGRVAAVALERRNVPPRERMNSSASSSSSCVVTPGRAVLAEQRERVGDAPRRHGPCRRSRPAPCG